MKPDFSKNGELLPAIIQHAQTLQVLMLGYMNEEAFTATQKLGFVTFYSRSRKCLWTKGETSGNKLQVVKMLPDCDNDTLLVYAIPTGPVCHTGQISCFEQQPAKGFLYGLEATIHQRINDNVESSYTNKLYRQGINKIAQKVGEEAVELIIETKDANRELFENEAADLLYHLLVLLKAKDTSLQEIESILMKREK